ncbi:putative acetyltransferase [Fructobacillus pseudoficulneus]|uniref:Putative acetyltransferase n=1 Tax=Fructobacillus pseudoficulneus TaxID=220714 RepID=A0A3F3GUS9_9LACO|nr:GNAT family N-acetyltransferase [Fructobacillus pseudoficulneus]GAP03161.1 putative acetyltransferase [Fructobacillus pseudoficulneus]SEH40947.1 ElaA protein [Fructobacillus pseudoficulneus]
MWHIKSFNELTNQEIWAIYRARAAVFVVDQQSLYQDVDEVDLEALHVFYEEDGELLAYGRVFVKEGDILSFGRVLTVPAARGRGLGKELIQQMMTVMAERFDQKDIEIEAQQHVIELYKRFGFTEVGDIFMDAGVPHILMVTQNEAATK